MQRPISIQRNPFAQNYITNRLSYEKNINFYAEDCMFFDCKGEGRGIESHGGAIMINCGFLTSASLECKRVGFITCTSEGSGGAIYACVHSTSLQYLCVANCRAEKDLAFSIFGNQIQLDDTCQYSCSNPQSFTASNVIGLSANDIRVDSINMTSNTIPRECAFVRSSYFATIYFKTSVFQTSAGQSGFHFESSRGDAFIAQSHFLGNNFDDFPLFVTNVILNITDSQLQIDTATFGVGPIYITQSRIDLLENEMDGISEGVTFNGCSYGQKMNKPKNIFEQVVCWDIGKSRATVSSKPVQMAKPPAAPPTFRSQIPWNAIVPIIAAFVSGISVLYIAQQMCSTRDPGVPAVMPA